MRTLRGAGGRGGGDPGHGAARRAGSPAICSRSQPSVGDSKAAFGGF